MPLIFWEVSLFFNAVFVKKNMIGLRVSCIPRNVLVLLGFFFFFVFSSYPFHELSLCFSMGSTIRISEWDEGRDSELPVEVKYSFFKKKLKVSEAPKKFGVSYMSCTLFLSVTEPKILLQILYGIFKSFTAPFLLVSHISRKVS